MKRFILVVLFGLLLTSCNTKETIITKHQENLLKLDSYIISFKEIKIKNGLPTESYQYLFVDNEHSLYSLKDVLELGDTLSPDDMIIEKSNNQLYTYLYNEGWTKYHINNKLEALTDFYLNAYDLFDVQIFETITNHYQSRIQASELNELVYGLLGIDISDEMKYETIIIQAKYDAEREMFTKLDIDLSNIEENWTLEIEFIEEILEFDLAVHEYSIDDYMNNFLYYDMYGLDAKDSFDLFRGSVNYMTDQDIISVQFEEESMYRLMLRDITEGASVDVQILDANLNVIREFRLSEHNEITRYYTYDSGLFYVIVTNNSDDVEVVDYSFLFLSTS